MADRGSVEELGEVPATVFGKNRPTVQSLRSSNKSSQNRSQSNDHSSTSLAFSQVLTDSREQELTSRFRGRSSDLLPNMLEPTNAARKKILHNGCSVATIAKFK